MYNEELFSGEETRVYTSKAANKLKEEVNAMSDADITSCDFGEWINYLVSKYQISPVVLYEDNATQALTEIKVKQYNPFSKHLPYEKDYYEVDGYRLTYTVPFDGDEHLWYLQPSYRILTSYRVESISAPHRDALGSISLGFEYTKREMEEKGDNLPNYIRDQIEQEFRSFRTMIGHVNNEVSTYNKSLADFAKKTLEERKAKAESYASISKLLAIPLNRSNIAPSATPVALKRIERVIETRPKQKPSQPEYVISDWDYDNINKIIYSVGTTMEKTARTYIGNNEEELRDHMLAALNTHYENATGETFRKIGKTDIQIEFENKAAFVGECKIWHGEKMFTEAIQQVINYTTWRDLRVSVIVFNKDNQSFRAVLDKIGKWVKDNTINFINKKENFFECDYFLSDSGTSVKLTILAFDLYVDKTQIKDNRLT